MSDTSKTDPWFVKAQRNHSDHNSYFQIVHDHTQGPCDLPSERPPSPKEFREDAFTPGRGSRCYWTPRADDEGKWCSCPECTGKYHRKWDRRRSRHEAKKYTKERYLNEY